MNGQTDGRTDDEIYRKIYRHTDVQTNMHTDGRTDRLALNNALDYSFRRHGTDKKTTNHFSVSFRVGFTCIKEFLY